jgi:hypothetical protein
MESRRDASDEGEVATPVDYHQGLAALSEVAVQLQNRGACRVAANG